jgi:hypothetical protein
MNDINWSQLLDGCRTPYDPRPALDSWRRGEGKIASRELWAKLLHQGDVDTAAYASTPELVKLLHLAQVDWNVYALIACIEDGRLAKQNPPVPAGLAHSYRTAWEAVVQPALRDLAAADDDLSVRSILAVLAHAKGQHSIAKLALLTEDERQTLLER